MIDKYSLRQFNENLYQSIGQVWFKVEKKRLWWHRSGNLVFGIILDFDSPSKSYDLYLVYADETWLEGDLKKLLCGGPLPVSRLTCKDDFEFEIEYPGGDQGYISHVLSSFLDSSSVTQNWINRIPDLWDLEKRSRDWIRFFTVLAEKLSKLKGLEDLRPYLGPNIEEGWKLIEREVRECRGKRSY